MYSSYNQTVLIKHVYKELELVLNLFFLYTSAALPLSFERSYTSCILTLLFPRTVVTYM